MKSLLIVLTSLLFFNSNQKAYIRINLVGYRPDNHKTAVWCSKEDRVIKEFKIIDVNTGKVVYTGNAGQPFGAYGPFVQTYRLNFTEFKSIGKFKIKVEETESPEFIVGFNVYTGAADFCLRYMRQQRTGYNPYLKDSCHTKDGYVLYGKNAGIPDSTHFDVVGGWHDASDYLQYSTTSANATWHLLAAHRDFPQAFKDRKLANGLDGKNGRADVLDEAKWGLDWLLKMHPKENIMFNQIADDRDHIGMRMPKMDNQYGRGYERPVYFIDGEVQQRGKFLNNTKGTSSTAAKFSSAFALGSEIFSDLDSSYSSTLSEKSSTAYQYAQKKPGVTQTASVKAPYIYAEENWVDDMELAAASRNRPDVAIMYAKREPITPWIGTDTASHYQWYPFINPGHYELAKQLDSPDYDTIINYYKEGIERVLRKASRNAFYRGVPFIWCSNNLTTSFAIQCLWYRKLTDDNQFMALEQANVDWLFGCNPWGTSMVYGLPAHGDTPVDPHSAFTHLKNYPIDGGLVDGPVYTSIYKNLIGIQLHETDEYAEFQSDLAVYHDDYGDYSTNEPTMDGTASLVYLLAAKDAEFKGLQFLDHGAITINLEASHQVALVFTGDEYFEGLPKITKALKDADVKAGFFFTGRMYENKQAKSLIKKLKKDGHYLGPHSDQHLLYNDWNNRDSLLVTKDSLVADLRRNYEKMKPFGIDHKDKLFIPPFEWWNEEVAAWCTELGVRVFSFTPGIPTNADYTYPEMGKSYKSTEDILKAVDRQQLPGGRIVLVHVGTDPRRKDKLYDRLPELIKLLQANNNKLVRIDELLK